MGEQVAKLNRDWQREILLGVPPTDPRWLRNNVLAGPVGLGLGWAFAAYFPTFSRPVALLGLSFWVPLTLWSVAVFFWAGRQRLCGDPATDRRTILHTTAATLPLQAVTAPMFATMLTVLGGRMLVDQGIIGSRGCVCLVLAYLLLLATSYTILSGPMVRLELDRLSKRPTTRLGRLMAPGMPNFTAMAICGVILSAVLVRIGGAELFVAGCALALAVYLTQACVANLERWRRFRRFMQSDGELLRERTTKD